MEGEFEIDDDLQRFTFEVLLSQSYFTGLVDRYPYLLGDCMERTIREEPFYLSENYRRITPAMLGVIQRIQRCDVNHGGGTLFLEAQILELIALQFTQIERPIAQNGPLQKPPSRPRMEWIAILYGLSRARRVDR